MLPPPPESAEFSPWLAVPAAGWPAHIPHQVKSWLNGDVCRALLVRRGEHTLRRALGGFWRTGDSEEIWHEYNVNRIDGALTAYDPGKGLQFRDYVPSRFDYYCRERAKVLRQRRGQEVGLDEGPEAGGRDAGVPGGVVLVASGNSMPDAELDARLLLDAMRACLPARELTLVLRHNLYADSFAELGRELGKSTVATRVMHHRAKHRLRDCLEGRGYL